MTKTNDVTFQHSAYRAAVRRWVLVDDCCAGQEAIKDKGVTYLPKPNPLDTSDKAQTRYDGYLARALYYNAIGRTLQGLNGIAFAKTPEQIIPASIDYVNSDIDGGGISLLQQAQSSLKEVLKKGRRGLLVDYPQTERPASVAEMAKGGIRAITVAYDASCITNWRTVKVGGVHKLSLVTLKEQHETVTEDGFGTESEVQYRVLRLTDGVYTQEVWRKENDKWAIAIPAFSPLNSVGGAWSEIPFAFIGAQNNDASVDESPLYDLSEVNAAHYINSAEYEDTVFLCGQVQPVMAGVDENWVKFLNEEGIEWGSRTMFPLPTGATFAFEQAQPNVLPYEAMKHKEALMIALGAQVVSENGQVKTATEANDNSTKNTSVLALAAGNVSDAYVKCLNWMAEFMGAAGDVVFEINQDYIEHKLDAQMLTALIAAFQSGKIPESDLWAELRKKGLIDSGKDDETIKGELESSGAGLALDE